MIEQFEFSPKPDFDLRPKITMEALRQMSFPEAIVFVHQLIITIQEKNPETSTLELYKQISASLPKKIPTEIQKKVGNAMKSSDPNEVNLAKEVAMFFRAYTILAATKPFLTGNPDLDEEIIQSAVCNILEGISEKRMGADDIYMLAKWGAATRFAQEYGMPTEWVLRTGPQVIKAIFEEVEQKMLNGRFFNRDAEGLISLLKSLTGTDEESIRKFVKAKFSGECIYVQRDQVAVLAEKNEATRSVLATLRERERLVLQGHYGDQKTLKEIGEKFGVSMERVSQIQEGALRKIRFKKLRELLYEENDRYFDSENPNSIR